MNIIKQSHLIRKAKNKFFEELIKKYHLTSNELNILIFLSENTVDTATDIVNQLFFTKSHVSSSIENLIKEGYITKYSDKDNKKVIHLKLTDQAIPPLEETKIKEKEFIKLVFQNISEEEIAVMEKVFMKMNENINNILK